MRLKLFKSIRYNKITGLKSRISSQMDQSYHSDAFKTERFFDEESILERRKVKVYIRTVTRKSIKIELPAQIALDQLKEIIHKKFLISHENQVMYLKGTCINHNKFILLENNWIIHVINLAEAQLPEIFIDIKAPTLTPKGLIPSKVAISPKIIVKNFIDESLISEYEVSSQEILLVESGRILKKHLTFIEQNIQNGTTINLIHSKKDECSKSSFKLPPQSEIKTIQKIDSKNKDTQYQNSQIDSISVKTLQKTDWKGLSIKKPVKGNICQVHDKKISFHKDYSQKVFSRQDSLKTIDLQPHKCSHTKNKTVQIGQRECNCKKDKQLQEVKEAKFITMEDRKRLSKEIREQNLQKLIRMKQKKEEELSMSPVTDRKPLEKVRSMGELKVRPFTEKKKEVVKGIANPEKQKKQKIFI